MNRDECKYVAKRITELTDRKAAVIRAEYRDEELTKDKKFTLIKEGKVKMLPFSELYPTMYLYQCYDFDAYKTEPDYEKREKRIEILLSEADQLKDIIILGNSEKALELLSEFSAKVF